MHMELATRGDNSGEIERKIRVVKERTRCGTNDIARVCKITTKITTDENLKEKNH